MDHLTILKQALRISWRYRVLWIFGFLLALCSGGNGGGGSNFNIPGGGTGGFEDLGQIPNVPDIDANLVMALILSLFCLVGILIIVGIVVRAVARSALIGMVAQIKEMEAVTLADGWRFGWSARAWRLFLVGLVIGIPVAIVSVFLLLLALSPLLLMLGDSTSLFAGGILLTVVAVLGVLFVLFIVSIVIAPLLELAWRRTVLGEAGVIDSVGEAIGLVRRRFKDVAIVWLLMFGVTIGWGIVSLLVVLPVSLIAAVLIGGIPAGLVYLVSNSGIGAAVAGIPPAILAIVLVGSLANGLYLVFQSAVWTLFYLELEETEEEVSPILSESAESKEDKSEEPESEDPAPADGPDPASPELG